MRTTGQRVGERVRSRAGWPRRFAVVVGGATVLLGMLQAPASATTIDPYTSGNSGFDISYPNCSATLPTGDSFAIVGVGGGRPFTANSCAGSEWSAAATVTSSIPSLYFNTGYAGAYARSIDRPCSTESASAGVYGNLAGHALSQAEQAWAIGCSEALYAQTVLPNDSPTMWWADIETGNSWSTNTSLNQFAIDGISYGMGNGQGGIYTSPSMWTKITGSTGWEPTPATAGHWVIGNDCLAANTFGTSPNWLTQGSTVNGVDSDTAC